MIKIDVEKINNWDIIKEKHSEWYEINILPNIRRVYNKLYKKDLNAFVEKKLKENLENNLKKNLKNCKNKLLFEEYKKHKKSEKDFIKKYLNILEKIIKKGKNFVTEEKEKFDEDLFDKTFLEDLKKDSKWYKDNILPNICEAYNELSNISEKDSIKEYLDILKKIKEGKKDFIVEKKSVKKFEKLNINKEYLPQNLLFYKDYLPDKLFDYEKLSKGRKDLDERRKKLDEEEKKLNERRKKLDKKRKKPDKEKKELDKKRKKLNEKRKKLDEDEEKKWSRHKLLFLMGIEVCPYCQRNYISNYEENNGKKTTADLDHFYPKSDYPFLALSLYNFIPSCQICNSRFKGNKDTCDSVYLYEEGFDELGVKFRTSKEVISETLGERYSDFYVKIDYENLKNKEDGEKVKNSIENLGLDRVYKKSHNQYIQNLLYNIEKYPENYLENCVEMFESDVDKKKQLEEYFKDIVKEPYRKRIENGEPLAKLTKDILEEFNIKI